MRSKEQTKKAIELFISYSHQDESWRDKLETHLAILKRQGVISTWHDRKIEPGVEWAGEIDKHIESADVILLLISPDFLASTYCYEIEMKRALQRHEKKDARVIPVILRPSDWKPTPFSKLQAVPRDGVAISKWGDEDDAFLSIAENIRQISQTFGRLGRDGDKTRNSGNQSGLLIFKDEEPFISIGVDIGTTKIAAGMIRISKGGQPEFNSDKIVRIEHDGKRNAEGVLAKIIRIVEQVLSQENLSKEGVDAIGLGLPGQVHRPTGNLIFAPGLQIEAINFCARLQGYFNIPVHADNDVNCSTFAELVHGRGSLYKNFVCLFVGTGIGAGIVINSNMMRGNNFAAGEVGHMKIDIRPDARECTCGNRGCYEEYASARAIIRLAREKIFDVIDRKRENLLKHEDPRTIKPEDIVDLVKKGDEGATEVMKAIAGYLAIGISNLANILNPEAIVLGGGIIEGFYEIPEFERTLNKKFREYTIPACATVEIVKTSYKCTEYGSAAPVVGAALLALEGNFVK
ncbi:MAG: ROK family protein [Gammaproteobacteria bacterium]|nr:ROK family protein [Gammaproteobacteria bacterium]